ncbi:MAG: TetR/AcrR family transcriptional regulator [Planctomycetota bacterium]
MRQVTRCSTLSTGLETKVGRPRETTDAEIIHATRQCLLERGVGVSAAEIAAVLGVSHTTLFHRFGSKEALLIAALGPSEDVEWISAVNEGPDERPIQAQLVEHARSIASYFREMQQRLGLLQAAGIDPARVCGSTNAQSSSPERAFQAFVAWLQRAQDDGRIADCNAETVASTVLGSLHGHAFLTQTLGLNRALPPGEDHVEQLVNVLWSGIAD